VLLSPSLADDFRHSLRPGEHEAFYFVFTASDGATFGLLRTLFGSDSLLEMLVLRHEGCTYFHQFRGPFAAPLSPEDASGSALRLQCEQPWASWRCGFQGLVRDTTGKEVSLALDLRFAATTSPALYRFGPYTQVQQDGRLCGSVRRDTLETWGEWVAYRDHSWGVRPMGVAQRWTLVCVPDHLYAVAVETDKGTQGFGRWITPEGETVSINIPVVTETDTGWVIVEAPRVGMEAWRVRRSAPPLVAYLGPAGHESFRDAPVPGDLLQDEMGPVLAIAPDGKGYPGFMEQARRIEWPSGC